MKKKKLVSLLLSLSLFCTTIMPGTAAYAAEEGSADSGMVINKTATANEDGTYTIQLEAYATGSKVITEEKKDIPTDIVLVLDQSGSMDDPIGTVSFQEYKDESTYWGTTYHTRNRDHYENRHNGGDGNLYFSLGCGAYASVSVVRQTIPTYTQITNGRNNSSGSWGESCTNYWNNRNNLYAKVNDVYQQVRVEREGGDYSWGEKTYIYSLPDGTVIAKSTGDTTSPSFEEIDDKVLYLIGEDESNASYTYTYTDANGETQLIGTSVGADTVFETTLYERVVNTNAGESRLNALKTAVTNFKNSVAKKAAGEDGVVGNEDDINHRIAVVGYASRYDSNYSWRNTEIFIGAEQYNYSTNASDYYSSAFQSMNTQQGQSNVTASISALDADGATYTNYGLEMANGILNANPVQDGEKRNRVIILFTDGYPGKNADDFNDTAANTALTQATSAKNSGVSLYSVGIFAGADATTVGDKDGTNTEAANWFMQQVSSNNGTPQNPSYYLSAADAETLNNIFQQISDQIESGGSATTLGSETVIKDIIAPAFSLPEGTEASDITLETYSCTGKNENDYTWSKNDSIMGASAVVNDDQVSVTGFNFAENYVGTVTENGEVNYRGDKLVITFNVLPKDGFLGGNNVYTNTSAGVYENSTVTEPVLIFQRPQVNVPIKDVTVTGEDKHVYLLDDLTAEELSSGAVVKVGDVELNLDSTATNFGLESWQTEYVDITVAITDKDGKQIVDMNDLTDDQTYTISVTVSPKSNGEGASGGVATDKSESDDGAVKVYKPELTFEDSIVYYGDAVPDFSSNLTDTKWKHGETEADTEKMGAAPELSLTYAPEAKKVSDGKINSKQDVAVDAAVKMDEIDITSKVGFVHTGCTDDCSWSENELDGMPAFLLHVKTCQLTITKSGGNDEEPYVFHIYRDGEEYSEVTIVGNSSESILELPVGTYTIREDENWSWRFYADNVNGVTLSANSDSGSITCANNQNENYWLNGYSEVVKNIFGNKN